MNLPIEIVNPSAVIIPQDWYKENALGLLIKRENKPMWRGVVVDFLNCGAMDGLRIGDEVMYNKNKSESVVIDGKEYHIAPDEYVFARVVENDE